MTVFYETGQAPVNSVLLLPTHSEATDFPTGTIRLALCHTCGFISNIDFNPQLTQYSARYEATQGYSPTFNAFHRRLAEDLIARYDLHNKDVIEIGCDKGDFLTMLCELGHNRGVGFDPAYVPGRHPSSAVPQLTFIADFYSEKYAQYHGDFICCKMTLEHIPDTAVFMRTIRQAIGDQPDTVVFFQVPNAHYVLHEIAFWDIYYEHCSYFSANSLAYLCQHTGFAVMDLWTDYNDQYLMIAARPAEPGAASLPITDGVAQVRADVDRFVSHHTQKKQAWAAKLAQIKRNGRSFVLWGGGSKGVAFLTTMGLTLADTQYVVDINPHKTGTFMAGTGQEIIAPAFLQTIRPDVVIIMNPIYRAEISHILQEMHLTPEIMTM